MIGKKAFTALLVLSAFVASIYSPIKILPLTLPMRTSTSPYNTLWNGTSEFYKALVDEGYEVHTVNSLNDIDRLITINDSILYIVIAPDIPFTQVEVERLLNTLSKVRELAFLIADENITSNALLSQLFNISVTGIVLKDKNSPYGPLYPIITCKLNNTEYVIVLNIASYIIIESSKGKDILSKLNDKPVIVYCFTEKYKGIVIADSSIFINQFFNEDYLNKSIPIRLTPIDNRYFALDLVKFLTNNSKEWKILIDCYHYRTLDINSLIGLPIPPIGLLLSLILTMSLRFIDTLYLTLLETLPVIIKILALILIILFTYSILRRLGGPYGFDERMYRHLETNVIYEVELPSRRIYDIKRLSKRDIVELLASLYIILCRIGLREFNIDFSKVEEREVQERINRIFKERSDRVLKTISKLRRIYEYYSGKRRFLWPPIIFWRRTLSKLILDSEMILETMGATIIGKPGVKGVEYRLRKI